MGLGKLGLPAALTLNVIGGHEVTGYDQSPRPWQILGGERYPHREADVAELLKRHTIGRAVDAYRLVDASDVVFIAVQTPHPPEYDGTRPLDGQSPVDFSYDWLVDALTEVGIAARLTGRPLTVVIVSTVLAGTISRELRSLVPATVRLLYQPYFISLGTVVENIRRPPFILVGHDGIADDRHVRELMREIYRPVWLPVEEYDYVVLYIHVVSYESAELAKMAFNVHQTMEITYANWLGSLAERTGANVDDVTNVLPLGYRAGMVDGGACRPRDLVAMAELETRHESVDLARSLIWLREAQSLELARLVRHHADTAKLPVIILGSSYKRETDLEDGSPTLLLRTILVANGIEPLVVGDPTVVHGPYERRAVYVVAVRHPEVALASFPPGSHVIDPWGIVPDQPDVTVRRLGRGGRRCSVT